MIEWKIFSSVTPSEFLERIGWVKKKETANSNIKKLIDRTNEVNFLIYLCI